MQCAISSVQCVVCSVQCAVFRVQCAECSVQCAVCRVQCATYSVQRALGRVKCELCSVCSVKYTLYYFSIHTKPCSTAGIVAATLLPSS